LFDNELDAAEELNSKGFHRGAGAIAGVVLEGHLVTVCDQHKISTPKNNAISHLNDLFEEKRRHRHRKLAVRPAFRRSAKPL
jgi:hypothetical protein